MASLEPCSRFRCLSSILSCLLLLACRSLLVSRRFLVLLRSRRVAVSLSSGGEAVANGCQFLIDADVGTLTIFTDGSNAFCRVDLDVMAEALLDAIAMLSPGNRVCVGG